LEFGDVSQVAKKAVQPIDSGNRRFKRGYKNVLIDQFVHEARRLFMVDSWRRLPYLPDERSKRRRFPREGEHLIEIVAANDTRNTRRRRRQSRLFDVTPSPTRHKQRSIREIS